MAGTGGTRRGDAALGGMMAAGSLAVLWLACAAPSGRVGLTAAAGLFPMAAALYAGRGAGWLCWAAASILGLILLPDKGVAALFLAFLGVYPVAKGRIESLGGRGLEWGLKLSCFNLTFTLFWFVFQTLLQPETPLWLEGNTLLCYLLGNLIFAAYDLGLTQIISRLRARLMGKKGR